MGKERKKFFRRESGRILLKALVIISRWMPLSVIYGLGAFMGRTGFRFIRGYRKVALESLNIAFPELKPEQRKEIAVNSFMFMAQSLLEAPHFFNDRSLINTIEIQGERYLKEALDRGKGVLAVTAHFGNFPLMVLYFALAGYPVNVVMRPMRDKDTGLYISRLLSRVKVNTIFSYPRKRCVHDIIRALRKNEIVLILMDQNFGTGGVWVRFFNKLAATSTGPFVFASRTMSAIMPVRIIRKTPGKHLIKIDPLFDLDPAGDFDEMVLNSTVAFTQIIEQWVRRDPNLWAWIHKRWKSRPSLAVREKKFKVQQT